MASKNDARHGIGLSKLWFIRFDAMSGVKKLPNFNAAINCTTSAFERLVIALYQGKKLCPVYGPFKTKNVSRILNLYPWNCAVLLIYKWNMPRRLVRVPHWHPNNFINGSMYANAVVWCRSLIKLTRIRDQEHFDMKPYQPMRYVYFAYGVAHLFAILALYS